MTTSCAGFMCFTSGVQTNAARDILGGAMKHLRWAPFYASLVLAAAVILQAAKTDSWTILTGPNAFSDSAKLVPGTSRKITPKDLPAPRAGTPGKQPNVPRAGAMPKAPAGFSVNIY